MPNYCDACGDPATDSCPYCKPQVYSCSKCVPICEHDARARASEKSVPAPKINPVFRYLVFLSACAFLAAGFSDFVLYKLDLPIWSQVLSVLLSFPVIVYVVWAVFPPYVE